MKNFKLLLIILFCFFAQYTNTKPQVPSLRKTSLEKLITNFINENFNSLKFNIQGFQELHSSLPWPLNYEFENAIYHYLSNRLNQEYKPFQNIQTYHVNIISVCISNDHQFILTGGNDSYLNIWRFNGNEYEHFQALAGHNIRVNPARISFIDISNDNEFIITASPDDNTVNIWRFNGINYQYFQPLQHDHLISAATMSYDKQKILIGILGTNEIKIWHFNKNEFIKPIPFKNPTESFIWNFNPKTYSEVFEVITKSSEIRNYVINDIDETIKSLNNLSIHTHQSNLLKLNKIKANFLTKIKPNLRNETFTRFTSDKSVMIAGNFDYPLTICQITKKGFVISQKLDCYSTIGTISTNTEFIMAANGSTFNIFRKATPKLPQDTIDLFSYLKNRQE